MRVRIFVKKYLTPNQAITSYCFDTGSDPLGPGSYGKIDRITLKVIVYTYRADPSA